MPPIITDQQRAILRELLDAEPGEMTRSQFDALPPSRQAAHCRAGGRIVNDPKPEHCPAPTFTAGQRPATASRAEFNRMTPQNQAEYCRLGLPIRD
jgi:hypothetical protein